MKSEINNKVEKTLRSLDGITQVEPGPYLLTRLRAAIGQKPQNIWNRVSGILTRPAVAGATVLLVVLVNVAVIRAHSPKHADQKVSAASRSDFSLNIGSVYDTENQEP